jgi:hypothetical protein
MVVTTLFYRTGVSNMNWFVHGTTSKHVGFIRDGNACEGGNCEHLTDGDQAYGQSSECDSFGSEVYLMCKECYEKFLVDRVTELVDCDDCGMDLPRNETRSYIPYSVDELPRIKFQKTICNTCWEMPQHQRRLEVDKEDRAADERELAENNDEFWDGDDIDDDDFDDLEDEDRIPGDQDMDSLLCVYDTGHPVKREIFNREFNGDVHLLHVYSKTIQRIVVGPKGEVNHG